ncbi:hypothetical protein KQX54_016903 [Cotesia glomerata]|uniref:Uncharacterized protein n=1 Tax=Cotesia glomerata TaxID=32391 RepID=A0AAV7I5T5_COTGL|nr:hypothetical protein KQX54_016903 [Cotesia glomerata]
MGMLCGNGQRRGTPDTNRDGSSAREREIYNISGSLFCRWGKDRVMLVLVLQNETKTETTKEEVDICGGELRIYPRNLDLNLVKLFGGALVKNCEKIAMVDKRGKFGGQGCSDLLQR